MRNFVVAGCLVVSLCVVALAEKPAGNKIVPAGAKLEKLFERSATISGGLTEGPAVAPDGSIYFTDIPNGPDKGMILRFDPAAKKTTVFTDDSGQANGLMFDAQGRLVACEGSDYGGRCVSRWDVESGEREVLADNYQGKRFNAPNDLCIDLSGRIYFTDPRYLGEEPRELEHRAVYRIDTEGTVVEVTHEVEKPNGIALSPDMRTLYVADHNNGTDRIVAGESARPGAMAIYAFPLGDDGLVEGERRTLVDYGDQAGCDGMTVDVEGNIYLTARGLKRPGVQVIDPRGKEVAFIATGPANQDGNPPVGMPSNVDFGIGEESKVLYVTIDKALYRIRLGIDGFHIPFE